jgi:hypothetical protein
MSVRTSGSERAPSRPPLGCDCSHRNGPPISLPAAAGKGETSNHLEISAQRLDALGKTLEPVPVGGSSLPEKLPCHEDYV